MAVEFVFSGESLTLATEEEFRAAVMFGRFIKREKGLSTYEYRGRKFILSDADLQDHDPRANGTST